MASTYLIDRYIYNSEYLEKWGQKYADDLQEYIQEHALASTDSAGIGRWVKEQKIIVMRIYKNDILIYDSEYPGDEIWREKIPGKIMHGRIPTPYSLLTAPGPQSWWGHMIIRFLITL